jgi:hypothetical protein
MMRPSWLLSTKLGSCTAITWYARRRANFTPNFFPFDERMANAQDCTTQTLIRNMLLPLDRKYAVTTTGVRSVWDLGLFFFRQKVASHPEIQRKTLLALLHQIQAERYGSNPNVLSLWYSLR